MQFNASQVAKQSEAILNSHSVLRNTYLLLSLTLLFSAATAYFAVASNAGFGSSLFATLASFGLIFVISGLRNSAWGILAVFAFTGCLGYSMGPLLNHFIRGYSNGGQLIAMALGITGLTFLGSSAYLLISKRNLSHWGKFLTIGLMVCLIAGLANLFFKMPALQLTISTMLAFISTLLMMYDTSRIINGGETNYLLATISLFIDIQMLFQNVLILLGVFNSKE